MAKGGPTILREQLEKLGTPQARAFLDDERRLTKLDRVVAGLSAERAAEVLRMVVNLEIDPDDHAWMLVGAAGAVAKIADDFPKRVEELIEKVNGAIERFDENDTASSRLRKKEFERLTEDLKSEAVRLAEAAMRSQFIEEEAKNKLRITTSIDAAVKDFRDRLLREKSLYAKEQARSLGVASLITLFTFAAGVFAGNWVGYSRAASSNAVPDSVYRLEVLGAGWEAYRSSLDPSERASADAYIAHHTVFLPNPRGR